ncbi:unnamed protein product, partial [Debaryomyces fabryi]
MMSNTSSNNIRRYILGEEGIALDNDIEEFEIMKFHYLKFFSKTIHHNKSHLEMVSKFFGIEKL